MAAFSLPDLIHQCRLARWEEEYSVMDTLELQPDERITYPLLLCAGQELKFKICASSPLAASIGFEAREPLDELPEPFIHNPEASCFVVDHEVRRTDFYLLAILNCSEVPAEVVVGIAATTRERSWRTVLEELVRLFADRIRYCRAISTIRTPGRPPQGSLGPE